MSALVLDENRALRLAVVQPGSTGQFVHPECTATARCPFPHRSSSCSCTRPTARTAQREGLHGETWQQLRVRGSAEEHGRTGIFFPPSVYVPVPITARAAKILADLGVGVGHRADSSVLERKVTAACA